MKPPFLRVIRVLSRRYIAKGMVDLGTPEDTLLATILSARTRDEQVLKIFPAFRKAFPTLPRLARANVQDIAKRISTIGLYRNKAKAIKALAERIVVVYGGKVPKTMDDLLTLPGVGRKTASCVLSYAFGIPAIAVDTHVRRITHRLGWTKAASPEKIERDLRKLFPEKWWNEINRTMVQFGRDICVPEKPKCWKCPVAKWCAYQPKTPAPSVRHLSRPAKFML